MSAALRLLGLGAGYGLAFMFVKSVFPEPFILLLLQGGSQDSSEGNLTLLSSVYISVGLIAGLVAAPIFGGVLLLLRARRARRGSPQVDPAGAPRLGFSLGLTALMGVISGTLTIGAYAAGILQSGGVLDPLKLIGNAIHPTGVPLLVAWAIARDLLPAGLTGLFLAPLGGSVLQRLYTGDRPPEQRSYEWEEV